MVAQINSSKNVSVCPVQSPVYMQDKPQPETVKAEFQALISASQGTLRANYIQLDTYDKKPGYISASDYHVAPDAYPKLHEISDQLWSCVESQMPSVVSLGEIHESPPNLILLDLVQRTIKSGRKAIVAFEMPKSLQTLSVDFFEGKSTSQSVMDLYGSKLLANYKGNAADVTSSYDYLRLFQGNHPFQLLLDYALILKNEGADIHFVDAEERFEMRNGSQFAQIVHDTDRDPTMGQALVELASKQAPQKQESELSPFVFFSNGLLHGRERQLEGMPDMPQYGIKGNVSAVAIASAALGDDKVYSICFPVANIESPQVRYSSFDAVVMWGSYRCDYITARMLMDFEKTGTAVSYDGYEEAKDYLGTLTQKK